MHLSCYGILMANLQLKNIPDTLHDRLRQHARKNRVTISATVMAAIERELERNEWRERLATRPKTDLGVRASDTLAEERALRDPGQAAFKSVRAIHRY